MGHSIVSAINLTIKDGRRSSFRALANVPHSLLLVPFRLGSTRTQSNFLFQERVSRYEKYISHIIGILVLELPIHYNVGMYR